VKLWHGIRARLCFLLGHRYIGDPHRKLCVYCWRERVIPYTPGDPDDSDHQNRPPAPPAR